MALTNEKVDKLVDLDKELFFMMRWSGINRIFRANLQLSGTGGMTFRPFVYRVKVCTRVRDEFSRNVSE